MYEVLLPSVKVCLLEAYTFGDPVSPVNQVESLVPGNDGFFRGRKEENLQSVRPLAYRVEILFQVTK